MINKYVVPESDYSQSQFYEINHLVQECLAAGLPTVLIDMPEILLRMKIGKERSLAELEAIFNNVANKIHRGEIVPCPPVAA